MTAIIANTINPTFAGTMPHTNLDKLGGTEILSYVGNAMSTSDDKFFQVVGKLLTTYVTNPQYVKVKTDELTSDVLKNGYNIAKYVLRSFTTATLSYDFLRIVSYKFEALSTKLEKKCGANQECVNVVMTTFVKNVVVNYNTLSIKNLNKLKSVIDIGLRNVNARCQDIIDDVLGLFFQYMEYFLSDPTFDNLLSNVIPAFMKKTIDTLQNHDLEDFFTEVFEILESPIFGMFVNSLIEDFESAI